MWNKRDLRRKVRRRIKEICRREARRGRKRCAGEGAMELLENFCRRKRRLGTKRICGRRHDGGSEAAQRRKGSCVLLSLAQWSRASLLSFSKINGVHHGAWAKAEPLRYLYYTPSASSLEEIEARKRFGRTDRLCKSSSETEDTTVDTRQSCARPPGLTLMTCLSRVAGSAYI